MRSFLLLVLCTMYQPLMNTPVCMHTHILTLSVEEKQKRYELSWWLKETPCSLAMIDLFSLTTELH